MMWSLREAFPLHFIIFKQTACHLPHEGNVEQIFSRAGLLSDPNLDPDHLATLVKVGYNKKAYEPMVKAIQRSTMRCSAARGARTTRMRAHRRRRRGRARHTVQRE